MTVTIELLDALKASNGGASDYRAAKLLGLSQPTVSNYRTGLKHFSDEKLVLVCSMLGIDPAPYLVRMQIERAKSDIGRDTWNALLARLAA